MIPKRIIQTGKTSQLSPPEQAAVAGIRALNPDFEYIYFTDADVAAFLHANFPQYLDTFKSFRHPIQKFDFFRYLAIYRLGGFYFDLDVFLSKPLATLLAHTCVFPFEELTLNRYLRATHGIDWEIGNYAFASEAGHPFLGAVIENCVRGHKDPAWVASMMRGIPTLFRSGFDVLNSTGPGLITRTLVERQDIATDVTVLFPNDVCNQASWHQFGAYGVHMMAASWRSRGSFIRTRFARYWETRTRAKLEQQSRNLGPTRVFPQIRHDTAHKTQVL